MMAIRKTFFVLVLISMVAYCKGGSPKILVEEAQLMPSPMIVGGGSAFMVIKNSGNGSDMLTGCSIREFSSASGMLHDFEEGKMKMVDEIEVPAGGTVELKRGAKHLMFSGLPEQLGESVTVILNFRKSGPVEVKTKVNMPQEAAR